MRALEISPITIDINLVPDIPCNSLNLDGTPGFHDGTPVPHLRRNILILLANNYRPFKGQSIGTGLLACV